MHLCSDFPYDANDENDNGYDEGLGSSLSSVGFSELKLGLQDTSDKCDGVLLDIFPTALGMAGPTHSNPSRSNAFPGPKLVKGSKSHNKKEGDASETKSARTHDANGKKIKRPSNAYMLWLKEARKSCPKTPYGKSGLTHEADKCASMGARWKMLDDQEKATWFAAAAAAKKQHQKDYPLWKYTPRSPKAGKKAQKRAPSSAARPFKRDCKRTARRNIAGIDFPAFDFPVLDPNSQTSSSSSSSRSDHSCDGLLVPLTPFCLEGQGGSSMQAFDMFAPPAILSADNNSSSRRSSSCSGYSCDELVEPLSSDSCDGLLVPLTPFCMEGQGGSSMQALNMFAAPAIPPADMAAINSMIIPGATSLLDQDLSNLLICFD